MTIRWYGLVAPEEAPTGDRRMFAVDALTYRQLPLPMAWQRVSSTGHQGSVIVGSWTRQYKGDGGVWGSGEFLDPTIVPEVTEAAYLLEKRLIGPSVDLDPDMAYEIVDHPTQPGEFAMKVTRGNVHGVTLVMSPAFPQVHLTVDTMAEMDALVASGILTAQFASSGVNSSSWTKFPLAPRETTFSADTAIENLAAWSEGNAAKFASAFLWQDPDGNPLNRETYRLPIADVINGKAYLIPRAVFSAGVIMSGGHGGLYDTLSEQDRVKVQEVITDIYDMLRDEYADPRVVAPWQRGGRQGARSEVDEPTRVASLENDMISEELDEYIRSRMASLIQGAQGGGDVGIAVADESDGEFQSRLNGELERYWTRGEGAAKIRWGTPGDFNRCVRNLREHFPADPEGLCANLHHEALGVWPGREHGKSGDHALVAGGEIVLGRPHASMFVDPKLGKPTPLVVTDEGRVYGHLATWKQCHMGVGNKCVIAPHSKADYKWFKTGSVVTHEGSTLRIGKITIGTGHADKRFGVIPATEHYDDTGTCVAVVNAGEDRFGVWVAGALVAGVTEDRIAELRRSPLSGDWRRVDGNLELVAALAVNNPGFPVLDEDTQGAYSLTAAGIVADLPGEDTFGVPDGGSEPDTGRFADVDQFLANYDQASRVTMLQDAFQDLPPTDCGCN